MKEVACYQLDLPDAKIHILDGGHDLLDTHFDQVLELIKDFLVEQNRR